MSRSAGDTFQLSRAATKVNALARPRRIPRKTAERCAGETLEVEVPEDARVQVVQVTLGGVPIDPSMSQEARLVTLALPENTVIEAGNTLCVEVRW